MKSAAALAALLGALVTAAAGPALAEPDNDARLALLEESENNLYFVMAGEPAGSGNLRDVWVFAAHKRPPTIGSDRIVGAWMHDRLDCAARTLAHSLAYALKDDFTEAFRDHTGTPPRVVPEASVDETVLEYACGTEMTLDDTVVGVREAVRRAQSQAN